MAYRVRMDVPIMLFRQAPEIPAGRPPLEERKVGEDYAHRQDRRVAEGELGGLQTYSTQRQYIVRKDEMYTIPQDDDSDTDSDTDTLGEVAMGTEAMGEARPNAPAVARDGSNAASGLLLRDEETGEYFDVTGVTLLPDQRNQIIHCNARRGNI